MKDPFVVADRLDWTTIDFKDNQPVIDLVSKKPKGLLVQLEEQGILGRRANNKALLQVCSTLLPEDTESTTAGWHISAYECLSRVSNMEFLVELL